MYLNSWSFLLLLPYGLAFGQATGKNSHLLMPSSHQGRVVSRDHHSEDGSSIKTSGGKPQFGKDVRGHLLRFTNKA